MMKPTSPNLRHATQRFALILAGLSVAACVVAAAWSAAAGGVTYAAENNRPALVLVLFLPIGLAAIGLHATWRGSPTRIWLSAGLLGGMLSLFSVGRGFIPALLLMLLAAIVLSVAHPSWWILTVPLWICAGITAIPLMLVVFGRLDFPINVFGSWLFASAGLALSACYVGRHLWSHNRRDVWWIPIFATVYLLLALLVVGRVIDAWQHLKQGFG
jgi:hypothetical protein